VAVYKTQGKQLLDNYAVVQTLEPTEIVVGQQVTIGSLGAPFNGTFTVLDTPLYEYIGVDGESGALMFNANIARENQVLFACTGADVTYTVVYTGTVTYTQSCSWVTVAQCETYLGVDIADPSDDYTLLTQARNAANDFCYRRRQESGYADSLTVSPGHDATLGTLMYAAALWRSRGSTQDTFATFDNMGQASVSAMTPVIKQLLGIDRPQVA
jgi:hypothetical protein